MRTWSGPRALAVRNVVFVAASGSASGARAGETTLAEPIVEENITDVDATKTGTLEIDVTGASLAAREPHEHGSWSSELEGEWRPIDRLGLGASLALNGETAGITPSDVAALSPRAAASYVFVRDLERRVFFQWEGAARFGEEDGPGRLRNPLEPALPYTLGIRWATRAGPVTLRSGFMGEAGGQFVHAPVRQSYAALLECVDSPFRVYLAAELIEDWGRTAPVVLVPEVLVLTRLFGTAVRAGIGVPATLGAGDESQAGIAFRIVLEPRE